MSNVNGDINSCMKSSIELGRLLAELQIRANKATSHDAKGEILDTLEFTLGKYTHSCNITNESESKIRRGLRNILDKSILANGNESAKAIAELAATTYSR